VSWTGTTGGPASEMKGQGPRITDEQVVAYTWSGNDVAGRCSLWWAPQSRRNGQIQPWFLKGPDPGQDGNPRRNPKRAAARFNAQTGRKGTIEFRDQALRARVLQLKKGKYSR